MNCFGGTYQGLNVLLTGHTGFKGSWMAAWLSKLGANVFGASLPPVKGESHWGLLGRPGGDGFVDIRDAKALASLVQHHKPDIVFHMAAMSLVRQAYQDPMECWSTNVIGTSSLLEACRGVSSVKAVIVVTTDKVYENQEWPWGYRENDRLGGKDPYSASKAAVELLVGSYRQVLSANESRSLIATARAGNVIGGGDWAKDRIIPDLVRSLYGTQPFLVRSPASTRPWQHVLDCLAGYLLLGQKLLSGQADFGDAWNFGPESSGNISVLDMLERLKKSWPELSWTVSETPGPHESGLLNLDCTKARLAMGWCPIWDVDTALLETAAWYRSYYSGSQVSTIEQIERFTASAAAANACWVGRGG